MTYDIERVYLAGPSDQKYIIIDTGSAQNLIGRHLLPTLEKRLNQSGYALKLIKAEKTFQFGGKAQSRSLYKTVIPLNMGGAMIYAETFIVDNEIPFLLGGKLLREQKTEIKISHNKMIINGRKIKLKLLDSGHMAIDWTEKTHGESTNDVLLATKVPRKDWSMPEVQAVMVKEIKNLQENGTYTEVPYEPWMVVIPSMWVIQRSADDDGKQAGNLKARLVV